MWINDVNKCFTVFSSVSRVWSNNIDSKNNLPSWCKKQTQNCIRLQEHAVKGLLGIQINTVKHFNKQGPHV